jgi:hypothetical protein
MSKNFPADVLERTVLHAVLDAVKDNDELIRKANEMFEQEKASILRSGRIDATEYHRQLDAIERQRVNYQRAFAADALSLGDLKSRTAELDAEKDHIRRVLVEHENRMGKLRTLEDIRDRSIRQIQHGEWGKLGMTTPETRQERYREIGLKAKAAADGTLQLSWGIAEEAVVGTAKPTS